MRQYSFEKSDLNKIEDAQVTPDRLGVCRGPWQDDLIGLRNILEVFEAFGTRDCYDGYEGHQDRMDRSLTLT